MSMRRPAAPSVSASSGWRNSCRWSRCCIGAARLRTVSTAARSPGWPRSARPRASAAIFVLAASGAPIWALYPALFAMGSARAFSGPANSSLLPEIVDAATFPRAVAMSTTMFQAATIAGPALGGLLFAVLGVKIFLVCAALALCAAPAVLSIRRPAGLSPRLGLDPAENNALAGLRYIWSNKTVLGAISLDLFAVLFGGATALVADLRARHSPCRADAAWASCARRRRRGPSRSACCSPPFRCGGEPGRKCSSRSRAMPLATIVFALSTSLRAVAGGAGGARRLRRGQHGGAPDPGPARHAQCDAGTGLGGQFPVHRRVQPTRRIRIRRRSRASWPGRRRTCSAAAPRWSWSRSGRPCSRNCARPTRSGRAVPPERWNSPARGRPPKISARRSGRSTSLSKRGLTKSASSATSEGNLRGTRHDPDHYKTFGQKGAADRRQGRVGGRAGARGGRSRRHEDQAGPCRGAGRARTRQARSMSNPRARRPIPAAFIRCSTTCRRRPPRPN